MDRTPAAEAQLAAAAETLERCCEIAAQLLRLAEDRRHDGGADRVSPAAPGPAAK